MGCLMPGRFFLGVGSGESLNEHITGEKWPSADVRQDMLEEAVQVIRLLHEGGEKSHFGKFFTVQDARVYNLPKQPVPIYVASSGKRSAKLAGRIGDGLIATSPSAETISTFERSGGKGKPRYGQLTVCWAKTEDEARRTALEFWPNAGLKGQFKNELPRVAFLEQAAANVTAEKLGEEMTCGPDPDRHLDAIAKFGEAGFDHVYVHQVGRDQAGFMRFYSREIIPKVSALAA